VPSWHFSQRRSVDGKVSGGFPVFEADAAMDVTHHGVCRAILDESTNLNWPEGIKLLQRNWIGRSEVQRSIQIDKSDQESRFTTRRHAYGGYVLCGAGHSLVDLLSRGAMARGTRDRERLARKIELNVPIVGKKKKRVFTAVRHYPAKQRKDSNLDR